MDPVGLLKQKRVDHESPLELDPGNPLELYPVEPLELDPELPMMTPDQSEHLEATREECLMRMNQNMELGLVQTAEVLPEYLRTLSPSSSEAVSRWI